MNTAQLEDKLREQLSQASQPTGHLVVPLRDLHRRGVRRRRQRVALTLAGVAAAVAVVIGGVQARVLLTEQPPASAPGAAGVTFPTELNGYKLAGQAVGIRGQTDFTATALPVATGGPAMIPGDLSLICQARDAQHHQVLVTSPGGKSALMPCSALPTALNNLGAGFDAGGMPLVRSQPIRLRLVDLSYRLGEPTVPQLTDPTAVLGVAAYRFP
ncbi:hypothetical protein GCM10009804_64850 [Kribbella hippodromi]|uniref:Uncharacterized protein n=1 Tax=Kribbella hippodromi TaxID=434347 RepID=A0ABP4Q3Q4_9ACTN